MTPAHDLVSAEYDQHKAEVIRTVRSKLSAAGIRSPDSDLDGSYNEAWHALYLALADGEEIENRIGYLVTVTHRRALNEFRALKVSRRIDVESLENVGVELDLDSRLDAEIQLRHIREGFRTRLSSRELDAATLCHLYGYSRPEAAKAMGVRPKRMEKIMDKASGKISSVVETVRAGEHCDSLSSTVRAFALGVLDPEGEKYQLAADHLEHCPACRREVWVDRGLAAIGPPLPLAFALLAGGATAGAGAAGAVLLGEGGKAGAVGSSAAGSSGAGVAGGGGAASGAGLAASTSAVVAGAVGVTAVAAVTVGLATGAIGGGNAGSGANGDATVTSSSAPAAGSSLAAAAAKKAAAARQAAKKKARVAAKRRQARRAALAAAASAAAAVPEAPDPPEPEPTYTPPPPPPPAPATPAPNNEPPPPKPTEDAGEEFGLR